MENFYFEVKGTIHHDGLVERRLGAVLTRVLNVASLSQREQDATRYRCSNVEPISDTHHDNQPH